MGLGNDHEWDKGHIALFPNFVLSAILKRSPIRRAFRMNHPTLTTITPPEIRKYREETPGVKRVLHFNNAGAALMPISVAEATFAYLRQEMEYGGYEAYRKNLPAFRRVYEDIADLIHAAPEEIALVESATVAWRMAFNGVKWEPGDTVITARSEYASNFIAYLQMKKRFGINVRVVPDDDHGMADLDALRKMLDHTVKLISITHIPTTGGLINPAVEIGKIAREHKILYLLDACQSVGQLPIDVDEIGCDFLSATGRKYLRGPRGTGFLYVRKTSMDQLEPPFLDLHSATWIAEDNYELNADASRFETFEGNYAGRLGLGEAVRYANEIGMERIWDRISYLAERLREKLQSVPGLSLHDLGNEKCGITTFSIENIQPKTIVDELEKRKINVSYSFREGTLLQLAPRNLTLINRASVHYYNSEDEIEQFVLALKDVRKNQA